MKAPLFFLLLATFQICLSAPIVNDDCDTAANGAGGAGGAEGPGGLGGLGGNGSSGSDGSDGSNGSDGSGLPAAGLPGASGLPGAGLPGASGLPGAGLPGASGLPGAGLPGASGLPGAGLPGASNLPGAGLPGASKLPGAGLPGASKLPGAGLPGVSGLPGAGLPGASGLPEAGLPGASKLPGAGLPGASGLPEGLPGPSEHPGLPGASPAVPLGQVMHSPVPGADAFNTPAKVGRGQAGALGNTNPMAHTVLETKSLGAEGAEKTAESASHLDLNQTAQNAISTGDAGVEQARKLTNEVPVPGAGAAGDFVASVYTAPSMLAHEKAATASGVANTADCGLTSGADV